MGSARALGRVFREHFGMHLAWVPLTTSLSLGDYGLWRGGVFVPLGNIAEFGVSVRRERGRESSLEYTSAGLVSVGGAAGRAPLVGAGSRGEAQLRFSQANACVVQVGRLTSERIGNVAEVSRKLSRQRGWRRRYKIVTELFRGEDVLLLVTSEKDTEIRIRGGLGARGRGSEGSMEVTASKRLGLEIVGGEGPIGLNVCRVRLGGASAVAFGDLEDGASEPEVETDEAPWELVEESPRDEPLDDPAESG